MKIEQPGPVYVVAAAMIDAAGRVLMQRRPAGKQHGGLWEFPGGKVEAGETPDAALVRELAEELGVVVAAKSFVPVGFVSVPPIVLLLYSCRAWSGTPQPIEGAVLQWCAPAAIDALAMPPADRPLVAALRRTL